ncbi:MAG: hypothetical protein ABIQ18_38020 [Umezawaea sp.]
MLADDGLHSRATVEAQGRLFDGYRPTDEEALVVWDDQDGEEQTTWLELDEPEREHRDSPSASGTTVT